MDYQVHSSAPVSGTINLPGDKSISHRSLMLGAISDGVTEIDNLSTGEDVKSTAACIQQLGVRVHFNKNLCCVHGKGLHGLRQSTEPLDVGNSGTTIRLLSGILAGFPFKSRISGDESIRKRPMSRIAKPLKRMGAMVTATEEEFAPLTIQGGELKAIDYTLPVASAQIKSCVLLAGLYAQGSTVVHEPALSRDHTERMLQSFGAKVERDGLSVSVDGRPVLQSQKLFVPGDISSAAFFIAAACLVEGSELVIKNVGINPTRDAILGLLTDMGADITIMNITTVNNEIIADLLIRHASLKSVTVGGKIIPKVIDEIPILAVLASQAEGVTEIHDAGELRYKESDRLKTVSQNLTAMGADVKETEDGLIIEGPVRLSGARLPAYGDHRIAMSFAIAGMIADGDSTILDAGCAEISFPGFYSMLEGVTIH